VYREGGEYLLGNCSLGLLLLVTGGFMFGEGD